MAAATHDNVDPVFMNPSIGTMMEILILRPLKGGGVINHGSLNPKP